MTCNAAGSVSSSPACHGPAAERARWADTYGAATSEGTDTVAVQLSFPPRQRRDENVIRTPQVLPHIVSLAEHRDLGDHLIDLDDLAVYADARHMHLIQLSTGKRVEALVPHALEGGLHTPPLARFLAEVSGARRAAYTAFDWGAAASMPFLPRLRHGRTVLCPARWLLRSADLGWFGRAHEILIPLRATGGRPSSPERRRSVGARLCVAARDAAELPGRSAWLHARIYGHPERHNEILTEYAPPLFDGWDDARSWWFTRHRDQARPDADQHLDLFVRLVADDRYGTAAGRVADCTAGLAEIEYATRAGASPDAVTAASLVDLAASYTPTPGEGCRWLIDHLPHEPGVLNPAVRDEALRLADPGRNRATLAAQPGGDRVGAAWPRRRAALDRTTRHGPVVTAATRTVQTAAVALAAEQAARRLALPEPAPGDQRWPAQSLFKGAAGIARYATALATLDRHVSTLTHRRLDDAEARIGRGDLPAFAEYDLLHGLTGIGAHLLRNAPGSDTLGRVLHYLVRLTAPLRVDGETLPGWWVYHDPQRSHSAGFPGEHGNLGIAHGITGPLALLAHAMRRGIVVDDHGEAIAAIYTWLDTWRDDTGAAPTWPQWITRAELHTGRLSHPSQLRPSWCYGTPGIARAQQLAALATADTARQDIAEHALAHCLADPTQLARITDTSLCHGWAGLHQTAWRAAREARTPAIADALPHLTDLLVRHGRPGHADGTGLLEGDAGLALALHTAAHPATEPISGWDACLLINTPIFSGEEDAPHARPHRTA